MAFNLAFIMFYILAVLFVLSIFYLIKSKFNLKKWVKVIGISLAITVILEVLLWFIGSSLRMFVVYCEAGKLGLVAGSCSSQFDIFFGSFPYTAIPLFITTLFVYSLVVFLRRKKK